MTDNKQHDTINIFLPAAGLGERLRPITNHAPKPLLPVLGKPLIEIILEKLAPVCTGKIGINLHYKPDMLRAWAAASPYAERIVFFPEDPILGTGGALKNAGSFLSNSPFLVHNADILLDIDFSGLIETHLRNRNIATLVTHRLPLLSNVVIDENDLVLDVENPGASRPDKTRIAKKVAYTGIALYSPEILQFLPAGVSHATVAWIDAGKAGHRVQAFDVTGAYWNDIGTPATYAAAVLDAVSRNGEMIYRSMSAACGEVSADGYVVLEAGCTVKDHSRLRNCIVMPGAIAAGEQENRIIGPDYVIELKESEMQPSLHARQHKHVQLSSPLMQHHFARTILATPSLQKETADALLIGMGGSDRRYYRVRNADTTAVLMECRQDDPDYERHLVYTEFFEAHAIPVPRLLALHEAEKRALFEDLGDTSLYSYLKLPRESDRIELLYQGVLDILVKLHGRATRHVEECLMLRERIFDQAYFRWETNYFLERFVVGLRHAAPTDPTALNQELDRLAQKAFAFPRVIIHRDFQSQNIMITAQDTPRVIDFQGARMAPAAYDIASILWDPYYRIDDAVRERLVEYYVNGMKQDAAGFDEGAFQESIVICRLQRHMQALGAYGFLAKEKGKTYFLKHVPEALRLLKEETGITKNDYPELYRLVKDLS